MKATMLIAALAVASFSTAAWADCRCSCVKGQIEPVCSSESDLPPVCAPRACSAKPMRTSLIDDKSFVATKTAKRCREVTVPNERTGAYVTKQVCE
jgi:hypothetical protein